MKKKKKKGFVEDRDVSDAGRAPVSYYGAEGGSCTLTYKQHGMFSCKLEPLRSVHLMVFLKQRRSNG